MKQIVFRKSLSLFLFLLACHPCLHATVTDICNEADSAYLFSYSTLKNNNRNGLHFAWSIDRKAWKGIGSEYRFLSSDYGSWLDQKRMLDPVTYQDKDGMWHCLFGLNEKEEAVAHTTSVDLILWKPQSYVYKDQGGGTLLQEKANRMNFREIVRISGEEQTGTIHKVAWQTIDALIKHYELATYKQTSYQETAATDSIRFASLKPVTATISIDSPQKKKISDMLIGIFFEDINYAADGGIYAELVQNRGFEYSLADKEGKDASWNSMKAWQLKGYKTTFTIDSIKPLHENNKHYALLEIEQPGAALINEGFDGIAVNAGEKYYFSYFSRVLNGKGGKILVRLVDKDGRVCGQTTVKSTSDHWKKQEVVFSTTQTTAHARLEIYPQFAGTVALDMISLFPQDTFKGRRNGMRKDLAQTLADIHPRFIRFPGGCMAHGNGLGNMYRWQNTIGSLEVRKPQRNMWGYHQTAGLGYFEYFQFCEDIGAEPLPVVPAGVPCQNSNVGGHGQQCGIPTHEMGDYIQEVLDLIEWANGDPQTTVWGRKRAEAGHPKPFQLKYIGVGNEDLISDVFEERYVMICNAIREKYPEMIVIGTVGPFYEGSDYEEGWRIATEINLPMVDEHYYNLPGWYIHNQDYYDRYDRNKPNVYLGEYAAHAAKRQSNLETALCEAIHLANIERNGDVVSLTSYAPLLGKEGFMQWAPDLIYFNNTEVKPTIGYYVQQLYGQNAGDEYIPSLVSLSDNRESVRKRVVTSMVRDTKTGDHIIKIVNMLPVSVHTTIDLKPLDGIGKNAVITILHGHPDDRVLEPVSTATSIPDMFTNELPAYSFTVVRIKNTK